MADVELLTQASFILDRCGRPQPPPGAKAALYLYRGIPVQQVFAASTGSPSQTVTKEVTGDTTFCLRSISMTSSAAQAISFQLLKPDGRFLVNTLQDSLQIAGYGSYRYLFNPELQCPAGSKLITTLLSTNTAAQQSISILYEGADLYLLKVGNPNRICPVDEAAGVLPRYFSNPNQNIMAPCWQHGVGPATPAGYEDIEFTYSAPSATSIDVTAANPTATQEIQIAGPEDFHVRRLCFDVKTSARQVTSGTFLARIRSGSGYALSDDYFDVERYIGSMPMPKDWTVKSGDSVFIDLLLVDQAGQHNLSIRTYLEGFKRRKVVYR